MDESQILGQGPAEGDRYLPLQGSSKSSVSNSLTGTSSFCDEDTHTIIFEWHRHGQEPSVRSVSPSPTRASPLDTENVFRRPLLQTPSNQGLDLLPTSSEDMEEVGRYIFDSPYISSDSSGQLVPENGVYEASNLFGEEGQVESDQCGEDAVKEVLFTKFSNELVSVGNASSNLTDDSESAFKMEISGDAEDDFQSNARISVNFAMEIYEEMDAWENISLTPVAANNSDSLEIRSAVQLQAQARGLIIRSRFLKCRRKTVQIQSLWRGQQDRGQRKVENFHATRLQSLFRSWLVRKQLNCSIINTQRTNCRTASEGNLPFQASFNLQVLVLLLLVNLAGLAWLLIVGTSSKCPHSADSYDLAKYQGTFPGEELSRTSTLPKRNTTSKLYSIFDGMAAGRHTNSTSSLPTTTLLFTCLKWGFDFGLAMDAPFTENVHRCTFADGLLTLTQMRQGITTCRFHGDEEFSIICQDKNKGDNTCRMVSTETSVDASVIVKGVRHFHAYHQLSGGRLHSYLSPGHGDIITQIEFCFKCL